MKKKVFVLMALMLALVLAMPVAAMANAPDAVPVRTENSVDFVPLRYAAYARGIEVYWDRETGLTFLTAPGGETIWINLDYFILEVGGFNYADRNWVPYEVAEYVFAMLLTSPDFIFTLTEEARDIILYDFDYLIDFILENSVWDYIFYRRFGGFDFLEYAASVRGLIEAMEPFPIFILDEEIFRMAFPIQEGDDARSLAANYLFSLLTLEFAPPLGSIGHLGPRTLDFYITQLTSFVREMYRNENNYWFAHVLEAFLHPSAVWLYGEVDVDLYAEGHVLSEVPGNIMAEVLVPDEVAFLRIGSFLANSYYDNLIILPFLQEIRDFEHLIIDIRSNTGGTMYYFPRLLMRILGEPVEIGSFEFFSGGGAAQEVMNIYLQMALRSIADADESLTSDVLLAEIHPAAAFVEEQGMVHFNLYNLERLEYVMVNRSVLFPSEYSINFEGKIWLLVDGWSASASAMAAEWALYAGFATIVGENTSGVMAASHTYTVLPNTGIIWRMDIGHRTDAYGRSLEVYGITPHIRNFIGMDALDTVLTIIGTDE